MINIISTQARTNRITGPNKVYKNLVKGLEKIGYPYVVNHDLNSTKRLWIQDDLVALRYLSRSKAYKVVGPNLVVMPQELPTKADLSGAVYLFPCDWPLRLWTDLGFSACQMAVWPVGVDTEEFYPSSDMRQNRSVMVYHKERDLQELVYILETVHALGLHCELVMYGKYNELEFKATLAKTNFIIWHGCHESQGLALQEAMASNAPILVCDATSLLQAKYSSFIFPSELAEFPVTSVPYFDNTCGIRITDLSQLADAIHEMLARRESFQPREYILKNLSMERQARAFISLWERWGLSWDDGFRERAYSSKQFSIPLSIRLWNLAIKVKSSLESHDAS